MIGARGHGRLQGALTGSVSQHVAQLAECPVVVVREPADPTTGTIVLGVDSDPLPARPAPGSRRAARFAFELADAHASPVLVLRGWADPWLDRSGTALPMKPDLDAGDREAEIQVLAESVKDCTQAHPGVTVTFDVRPVHPQRLLVDASQHAALVVVGSRGRGAMSGMLLGSVSQSVLQRASCPVAVVR